MVVKVYTVKYHPEKHISKRTHFLSGSFLHICPQNVRTFITASVSHTKKTYNHHTEVEELISLFNPSKEVKVQVLEINLSINNK